MRHEGRVAWREGLFLRPHHFQQQDRFTDSLIRARTEFLRPYPWGLVEFGINEQLASMGKFAVEQCSGLFPDGQPFAIPSDFAPPTPLDVPAGTRDAIVYLTLPAQQTGGADFQSSSSADEATRFIVDERDLVDAFAEERALESIEIARPNLRLGVRAEHLEGRVKIGLARIREVDNGRIIFDERYIPPHLHLTASARLQGILADIRVRAEVCGDELALRAVESADGGAETFASFLILQALNRWIPVLRHLESLPSLHPERLFETFISMAGELSTLTSADRKSPVFPVYDHENLQATYEPVVEALQRALRGYHPRAAHQLELEHVAEGAYVSRITDRDLYANGYFFLAVSSAIPLDEIRARFPSVAKVGAIQKMQQMIEAALPGVPLRHTPTPPPQLRVLPGFVYFELDRSSPDWRDFATAPSLGLHVAGNWPRLRLELWCVRSKVGP